MTRGRREVHDAERPAERLAEVQRRRDDHTRSLLDLLTRRPDLEGVHARADWAAESLRWTA